MRFLDVILGSNTYQGVLFSKEETMMKFIENKKVVIAILSVLGTFAVYSNASAAGDLVIAEKSIKKDQTSVEATKVALSVSREEKLEKYENTTSLSDQQLKDLLKLVGFKGQNLKEAWAIAKRESNGRPFAFNGNLDTGDKSYGIFQINMLGILGPDRRDKFELDHNVDLFNPVINAQIAFHMSKGGEDWSAWNGLTPRAKEWISKFPQ